MAVGQNQVGRGGAIVVQVVKAVCAARIGTREVGACQRGKVEVRIRKVLASEVGAGKIKPLNAKIAVYASRGQLPAYQACRQWRAIPPRRAERGGEAKPGRPQGQCAIASATRWTTLLHAADP